LTLVLPAVKTFNTQHISTVINTSSISTSTYQHIKTKHHINMATHHHANNINTIIKTSTQSHQLIKTPKYQHALVLEYRKVTSVGTVPSSKSRYPQLTIRKIFEASHLFSDPLSLPIRRFDFQLSSPLLYLTFDIFMR
jgi:hypothetical protein